MIADGFVATFSAIRRRTKKRKVEIARSGSNSRKLEHSPIERKTPSVRGVVTHVYVVGVAARNVNPGHTLLHNLPVRPPGNWGNKTKRSCVRKSTIDGKIKSTHSR